jgi:adenosylcobinamide-phosphate synthase
MRLGRGGEVAAALLVDALFGEPPEDLHPTVWMGRAISAFEKRALKSKSPRVRRLAGVALASAVPTLVYLSVRISLVGTPRPLRGALGATLISTSLSMRGLSRAARAVEHELLEGDLERAQASVGALVGRDTEGLSKAEISRAVVESVAENASDGVIGPMLYGFLFGAPGAL